MPDTHVIRLRSPWSQQAHGLSVSWVRRFNSPTGLDGSQQVWMLIEDVPAAGTARVNGHTLGPLLPGQNNEYEITGILALHNQVCLELDVGSKQAGLLPDPQTVRLEIRTRSKLI